MSKVLKVLAAIAGVLAIAYGLGFVMPSQVHVERAIAIEAPAEDVFASISDFEAWEAWSPWAKLDPDATMTVMGSGLGQKMVWASDDPEVGEGSQEITALEAPNVLKTHLEFNGQGIADASFELIPRDGVTEVIWSLDSDMREGVPVLAQPISTYFGFAMDSMVGRDYESGLQNLKAVVEERSTD